ncbi:MAG: hypothetical protein JWM32_217 [Verrucomicrobia bacterium]|nr:hypothetical protein [Verrucomicrobiota bacterium]
MDAALMRTLKAAGKPADAVVLADGTRLLVLPYGGRVLGLFAPGDRGNFFWVNPVLRRARTARAFFAADRWQNLGGERTWIGPEFAFFFPRFPALEGYRPPHAFDATTFRVKRQKDGYALAAEFRVHCRAPVAAVTVRLTKRIEPAPDPLRAGTGSENVRYAGYTLRSTLELIETDSRAVQLGLWSIAQLPPGGEMLIPVYGRVKPRVFFGRIPRGDLQVRRSLIRYRMRSAGEHKIGVTAAAGTGRIGYVRRAEDGTAELVVRNHSVNPSGVYRDAPASLPAEGGYAVEACSVNHPELGRFAELEHHAPAIGVAHPRGEDLVQMWAYRGPARQLARIAETLLGAPFLGSE